jgi:hypothetical protein
MLGDRLCVKNKKVMCVYNNTMRMGEESENSFDELWYVVA